MGFNSGFKGSILTEVLAILTDAFCVFHAKEITGSPQSLLGNSNSHREPNSYQRKSIIN